LSDMDPEPVRLFFHVLEIAGRKERSVGNTRCDKGSIDAAKGEGIAKDRL
jgi:hypothetical protein